MKLSQWEIPRFIVFLFSLQKFFLFKLHFLRYAPRFQSKLSSRIIKFDISHKVQNNLVFFGAHWEKDNDIEASSQKIRGTRKFISSVNGGLYKKGFNELLRLPFFPDRSTAYDLSERINYCFLLFICQDKKISSKERILIKNLTNYVIKNLEYYGRRWTNNHYLNNARALLSASIMLEDHRLASRAIHILEHALKVNFPDGIFQERSSSYQCLIVYWLKSIYFYLDLIEGTKALRQTVLNLISKNEIIGLELLNFGDNTPDFSKVNIQCLSKFFDQFLPNREFNSESEWISCMNLGNFEFSIITEEHKRFGPEHGYRNLACFHLTFNGQPIFLSTARPSSNKESLMIDNPELLSSGHIFLDGKSIYSQKANLRMLNYCTDPKNLPSVLKISKDSQRNNFSLLINSMHGVIKESFYFSSNEFFIELFQQNRKSITLSFLIPEEFTFTNGYLDSKNLKLSVMTSKNLINLKTNLCSYSDEYGVSKNGWQLIALFGPVNPGEASFIKFKEK